MEWDAVECRVENDRLSTATGGKDQCTGLVHHKYITRKWTVYHACAHLVHHKYFQNFPCWFPHDVPSQETASTFTVFQVM